METNDGDQGFNVKSFEKIPKQNDRNQGFHVEVAYSIVFFFFFFFCRKYFKKRKLFLHFLTLYAEKFFKNKMFQI